MRVCMSQRPSAPLRRTVTFKIPMVKHRLQGRGLITVAVSDTVYCKPFGTKIDSQIHIIKTVAVVTVKLQETDELQTTVFFFYSLPLPPPIRARQLPPVMSMCFAAGLSSIRDRGVCVHFQCCR